MSNAFQRPSQTPAARDDDAPTPASASEKPGAKFPPGGPPANEDMTERLETLAEDLDALANLQRLRLLHLLTRPHYAEELSHALGMSRQSALKHIAKLQERGFVRAVHGRRASGPVIEFLVVPSRLFALGVSLGDLGKLEPEGGPKVHFNERTSVIQEDGSLPSAPAEPSPRPAHLLIVNGPMAGTRFLLESNRQRWTIGRDEDRDLRVAHDPFVSARHAEVQTDWQGPMLVDVFSANGTFVNFARLPRGGRVPLRPGDVVGVGHTTMVYQCD